MCELYCDYSTSHDRAQIFWGHATSILFPSFFSFSQDFLTKLVCNLLDEGNAFFRDSEWEKAVREFSEGLNVSQYATAEDLQIPEVLLESLYVNRAAAYYSMVRQIYVIMQVCSSSVHQTVVWQNAYGSN